MNLISSGASGQPTTLQANSDETVIIQPATVDATNNTVVDLIDKSSNTFDGIILDGHNHLVSYCWQNELTSHHNVF